MAWHGVWRSGVYESKLLHIIPSYSTCIQAATHESKQLCITRESPCPVYVESQWANLGQTPGQTLGRPWADPCPFWADPFSGGRKSLEIVGSGISGNPTERPFYNSKRRKRRSAATTGMEGIRAAIISRILAVLMCSLDRFVCRGHLLSCYRGCLTLCYSI